MKILSKAASIFDRILDLFGVLAGMVIVAIMLAVSIKVVFRYFLLARLMGVDELAETALLYISFLGAAWLLRREGHVSIDVLFTRLRKKTQSRLTIVTSLIAAVMSMILVYSGTLTTIDTWQRGVVTPTILEVPRSVIFAIIPVGSAMLTIQFLRRAWSHFRGNEHGPSKTIDM